MKLLIFFAVAPALWCAVDGGPECQDQARREIRAISERWAWELYWDGGTSGFHYQPRENTAVRTFFNHDLVGLCSLDLGLCTAYERSGNRLGQFCLSSERLRGPDLEVATRSFIQTIAEPRVVRNEAMAAPGVSGSEALSTGQAGGGGISLSVPIPHQEVVVKRDIAAIRACTVTTNSFPPLQAPLAIRSKIVPASLAAFEKWLREQIPRDSSTRYGFVIPYYSDSDPLVYVLVRANGRTQSVILALPGRGDSDWRIGGHFELDESPAEVKRLQALILTARMRSVWR